MNEVIEVQKNELQQAGEMQVTTVSEEPEVMEATLENRLEILGEWIRKKYLARLTEMQIAPLPDNMISLEDDLIDNVRLYHIKEMVYQKGESSLDKFTTVFNSLYAYDATLFVILDSDGKKTDIYLGVRNDEKDIQKKRSTVTLGDTLKNALIGHFPGVKIENEDREHIHVLCKKIEEKHNLSSVSVAGNSKGKKEQTNEQFVQGLEKLLLSMQGREYIGVIIADKQSSHDIEIIRQNYMELYTRLSPLQKVQTTESTSEGKTRSQSFTEMTGKQKAAMIGSALAPVLTTIGAAGLAGKAAAAAVQAASGVVETAATTVGTEAASTTAGGLLNAAYGGVGGAGLMMVGGQVGSQLGSLINSLAPVETISQTASKSQSSTVENKAVTEMLRRIDDILKRTDEFDSYGMWNVAAYFISDDMSAAEIAAGNYRSLMNGDESGREVSAINSWRMNDPNLSGSFQDLVKSLSRFRHPTFFYGYTGEYRNIVNAATYISGKELGLHIGLPRASVPGFPVIEHAEFGKEVYAYQLEGDQKESRPEDRMTLGRVFDLGQITNKTVELDNNSLTMHTFITGSTGSGKSNTVNQILSELHQDHIPFLVVEPAKGEYKDKFGILPDVNVYSTNPNIAQLININPFKFPDSIHVLEHVDGLVEIFSVCWPMYDAMPAFFKDAVLRSYEMVGWDLGASTYEGNSKTPEYPDFDDLAMQLDELIEQSDYASDIKSNYRGALLTRVKSLTVGLNKYIFTSEQTSYEKLFDQNCILDISRVKSSETKALLMGLIVYILNEYRTFQKSGGSKKLNHVTVLEEAHNILKNTPETGESGIIGKSVEMLTQTIAEIRSYGEGFIIVDQSPSSVDISAIKNTNTKIVLRTPEANDREAIGRSVGLTPDQINEIAKLPKGVAVVYQNDWVKPVLTKINKVSEKPTRYTPEQKTRIMRLRTARTMLLRMLLSRWLDNSTEKEENLQDALRVVNLSKSDRKTVESLIRRYNQGGGILFWRNEEIQTTLRGLLRTLLEITDSDFQSMNSSLEFEGYIRSKTKGLKIKEAQRAVDILTMPFEDSD